MERPLSAITADWSLPLTADFLLIAVIVLLHDIGYPRLSHHSFSYAKLGRCSGCKGKFALRVPPIFGKRKMRQSPLRLDFTFSST